MKERPILFGGAMVRAILDGTKTQTRRVVKPRPNSGPNGEMVDLGNGWGLLDGVLSGLWFCPYGRSGDRLWVRESWGLSLCGNRVSLAPEAWPDGWPVERLRYAADFETREEWIAAIGSSCGRPSIHMPRWASRITLEITNVRVQRLQEISGEDCEAEGVAHFHDIVDCRRESFEMLWDRINAKRAPWSSNPWVWVLCFRRVP